jgi:hypothetical protein
LESSSAEFGGSPISFELGKWGDDGVGGLGSRLEILFCDEDGWTPFIVGEVDSTGLPFSIRYSYYKLLNIYLRWNLPLPLRRRWNGL